MYRVGAGASSAATSTAVDIEVLIEVIAQAAVRGVRTRATVERVTIALSRCVAADGTIAGHDEAVAWLVTPVAADSARKAGGADRPDRRAASKQGSEKQERQRRAPADEGRARCFDALAREGLSCPTTR